MHSVCGEQEKKILLWTISLFKDWLLQFHIYTSFPWLLSLSSGAIVVKGFAQGPHTHTLLGIWHTLVKSCRSQDLN